MALEHVLVVDDVEVNLKLLAVLLTSRGYRVRTATSAEAALEILATYRPALVLLDVRLPGMSGLELARRLRADVEYARMVIIAVTANAMKGDREAALAAGCDAYVTKPIDTRTLPALLEQELGRKGAS